MTSSSQRVLLVGSDDPMLPAAIERDSDQSIVVEAIKAVHVALGRIVEKGCDAVVCWAEREDELTGVIRIRKANPALPILLLTSRTEPEFEALARRMGANQLAPKHRDLGALSETIRLALTTGELARGLRAEVGQARSLSREVAALAQENRKLIQEALRSGSPAIRKP